MKSLHLTFATRALEGAESLPPSERAELYDVAAEFLKTRHGEASAALAMSAHHLREAEASQLLFKTLLIPAA